jgi:small subunit ribosomal protein S8
MLTRIRNAYGAGHEVVDMPHSRLKGEIARILKKEGFITDYVVEGGGRKNLRLYLKYAAEHEPVIRGVKRESRPGLRRYVNAADVPRVLGGLGVAILSTSSGVMTDKDAREKHVGGEHLCSVW